MLSPLNNIIPDIATMSKKVITNDFCESLLLLEINIPTYWNIVNKPKFSLGRCSSIKRYTSGSGSVVSAMLAPLI